MNTGLPSRYCCYQAEEAAGEKLSLDVTDPQAATHHYYHSKYVTLRLSREKNPARYSLTLSTYKKNQPLSEQQSMFPEIFSIVGLIVVALSVSKAERAKNLVRLTRVDPTLTLNLTI